MKETKHINEEINSISIVLGELRENDAIKNMEQSFVDREAEIISAIQSSSSRNSELPKFLPDNLSYQDCFFVPENYFETTEKAIIQKINNTNQSVKIISLPQWLRYAVAASVVFLLGLTFVRYYSGMKQSTISSEETISKQINSLQESEMLYYLRNTGTDVEAALVASVSEDENLPSEEEILLNEDIFTNLNISSQNQNGSL